MARRNLFQPPPPPGKPAEDSDMENRPRFPNTGAMSGVKSTLRDLSSNAVRELDPGLIDDEGPKDRLAITDADVASLAESIKLHGQQVPILVRPLPHAPGRFQVVYGRRRLRALKLAGLPAKALVRTLSDEQAIVAQGQENNLRLDPSFIEKARFAVQLAEARYAPSVILDALVIDKPMYSRMTKVARAIPAGVLEFVGAAHGIGRRRWEELADRALEHSIDLMRIVDNLPADLAGRASEDRFSRLLTAVNEATSPATPDSHLSNPARLISDDTGRAVAEMKLSATALTIRLPRKSDTGFADWLLKHADQEMLRLYRSWQATQNT